MYLLRPRTAWLARSRFTWRRHSSHRRAACAFLLNNAVHVPSTPIRRASPGSASPVRVASMWASPQVEALLRAARRAAETSPRRVEAIRAINDQIRAVSPDTFATNPVALAAFPALNRVHRRVPPDHPLPLHPRPGLHRPKGVHRKPASQPFVPLREIRGIPPPDPTPPQNTPPPPVVHIVL